MRFNLIDRVLSCEGESITAIKTVTVAEEYLGDHFPGFPVLPGVMMLETLVQAGRRWVAERDDAPPAPLVVGEVRNVKYGNMVRPGQTLRVDVKLRKQNDTEFAFEGVGQVDNQVAVKGRFTLVPLTAEN